MMPKNVKQLILVFAIVLLGFGGIYGLSNYIEPRLVRMPEDYQDADLAIRGKSLKGWTLGSEGLLADWYWMWSLQYIGNKIVNSNIEEINLDDLRSLNPKLLHPLLDNAAELDPKFLAVYSYAATVLPAVDARLAIELTEKGIRENPEAWRLHQYLGYVYWRMKDYENAARVYEEGSRIAGAPPFMLQMVAAMKTQGGSRETAREIYLQMRDEAEDQQSRENAELRLMELDSLDQRDAITKILQSRMSETKRCPDGLKEILAEISRIRLPHGNSFSVNANGEIVDPAGVPYSIDRDRCILVLGTNSPIPRPL